MIAWKLVVVGGSWILGSWKRNELKFSEICLIKNYYSFDLQNTKLYILKRTTINVIPSVFYYFYDVGLCFLNQLSSKSY